MAGNINKRLDQLKKRRSGSDRLDRLNETARAEVILKNLLDEGWQKRALLQPNTRYALGAMAEVDADYTKKSIDTAERVGKQLDEKLTGKGWSVEFRLQGSVPLNVHIRGVSDVDLLNLDRNFWTYATAGIWAQMGNYRSPASETSVERLSRLRKDCETVLVAAYPAATVDLSGGKAITLSGGSLARPVDVVPSHWHDTVQYQNSSNERDRGVKILDKKKWETVDNLPFLHIAKIDQKDRLEAGFGLKKSIRLCKNVKQDAIDDGKTITLPSFDIAAIMFHADQSALRTGTFYELAVLAETQRFLDYLLNNKSFARSLWVPDGCRPIFDNEDKFTGLSVLSAEINDLAIQVAKEQSQDLRMRDSVTLNESRNVISNVLVPG